MRIRGGRVGGVEAEGAKFGGGEKKEKRLSLRGRCGGGKVGGEEREGAESEG
jgi:hypothetical protein